MAFGDFKGLPSGQMDLFKFKDLGPQRASSGGLKANLVVDHQNCVLLNRQAACKFQGLTQSDLWAVLPILQTDCGWGKAQQGQGFFMALPRERPQGMAG